GFPGTVTAGSSQAFSVTVKDAFNNTVTSYTGIVHFTSSDAGATLPANYTFVGGDAGVHAFNATLNTVGSQSITATDTVTGSVTGSQGGITVNAGAATTLTVATFTSPTVAGVSHNFTVTVKDVGGNTVTAYT